MIDALEEQLQALDLTLDEFSALCLRLLDYSILSRDDSQIEQQLYDRYVRCEPLVEAYFRVLRIRVWHDRQFRFVRLYPPGAAVPGADADSDDPRVGSALRVRPTQADVGVILVLRQLYDQGVRDARIDNDGAVRVTLADVGVALQTLLDRHLPEPVTERRALWRRLRQWRLVRWAEGDDPARADDNASDVALLIRPTIVSLVSDEVLSQLDQSADANNDPET